MGGAGGHSPRKQPPGFSSSSLARSSRRPSPANRFASDLSDTTGLSAPAIARNLFTCAPTPHPAISSFGCHACNYDPVSEGGRGGNTDGFGYHARKGSTGNIFRGCRAWFDSDDGFDFINSDEVARIENCWAFYNGYSTSFAPLGDANGLKAGGESGRRVEQLPNPIPRHVVVGSVAVRNKVNGFYANHHSGGLEWTNNTAYKNRTNFNLRGRDLKDHRSVIPGRGHVLKNNLGFAGDVEVAELDAAASEVSANAFTLPVTITAEDFLGLDKADLVKPRKPNGDLPDLPFLHLAPSSDAIDQGVDFGRPSKGQAPDLGAFESV